MNPDHTDLSNKIAQAKIQLPMPRLLAKLDLSKHAKKSAHCPFPGHDDKHPSFSIFKGNDGFWHYKCFVCEPEGGDEITFLSKWNEISRSAAISLYLDMAGFPPLRPPVSREYPESLDGCVSGSPVSPESLVFPVYLVSPVSEGQGAEGEIEQELKVLAARNVCTSQKGAGKRRFKLARDLAAVEKRIGQQLTIPELQIVASEWHRLSQPFLHPTESGEDHFMALVAELEKVRYPTGEGMIKEAIERASRLLLNDLPPIPGYPQAPEELRRMAALHCELWRANGGQQYFLSYRDAAKVRPGLSPGQAHHRTHTLKRCGVIKIMDKGRAGPNSEKAAEFRYLLPRSEDGALDDDGLLEI